MIESRRSFIKKAAAAFLGVHTKSVSTQIIDIFADSFSEFSEKEISSLISFDVNFINLKHILSAELDGDIEKRTSDTLSDSMFLAKRMLRISENGPLTKGVHEAAKNTFLHQSERLVSATNTLFKCSEDTLRAVERANELILKKVENRETKKVAQMIKVERGQILDILREVSEKLTDQKKAVILKTIAAEKIKTEKDYDSRLVNYRHDFIDTASAKKAGGYPVPDQLKADDDYAPREALTGKQSEHYPGSKWQIRVANPSDGHILRI